MCALRSPAEPTSRGAPPPPVAQSLGVSGLRVSPDSCWVSVSPSASERAPSADRRLCLPGSVAAPARAHTLSPAVLPLTPLRQRQGRPHAGGPGRAASP